MSKIGPEFFMRPPAVCARELIGCIFQWGPCSGRIVETEAYSSNDDEACHTWFRPSAREFVATHAAGSAYVYLNYGVHWLFNVLVKGAEESGFVLLRALEPLEGIDFMLQRRAGASIKTLCAGPGRLTRAMGISGSDHGNSFLQNPTKGITSSNNKGILSGGRIGISRAIQKKWRFAEKNSNFLSAKIL